MDGISKPEGAAPVAAFVGVSAAIRLAREQIGRLKDLPLPLAVVGATGTGKEVVAQQLHVLSRRAATGDFVAVNCGALPKGTIESSFFGHEAGAFTGADRRHHGYFEQADRGTLFLDEFGELSLPVQALFLRVLEEGKIRRMGGEQTIRVDFRLIVSSQQPLETLKDEGRLREDLFHRLDRMTILLPRLSERPEDLAPLADHFNRILADHYGREPLELEPEILEALSRHHWPGNVRELRNEIEQAILEGKGAAGVAEHLAAEARKRGGTGRRGRPAIDKSECRRRAQEAMKSAAGDYRAAAGFLGVSQTTLYRWLGGFPGKILGKV